MTDPARIPVILGVGELRDRPEDPALALEPLSLLEAALRAAEADAGAPLLGRMDSLDVVQVVSWPYADLPSQLCARVEAHPSRRRHGPVGGHTPLLFLAEAAARIARGEGGLAAVCGAEASHAATLARRLGLPLPWTPPPGGTDAPAAGRADAWLPARARDYLHPLARAHGLTEPLDVYPLYETAAHPRWNQTPAEARSESAALWSAMSAVAARSPAAWSTRPVPAEEIARPSASNRPVAWPYTKLTVANPAVNQGAAVLVGSLALARSLGLREDRLAFVHGAAAAAELLDWTTRPTLHDSPAQRVVLEAMLRDLDEGGGNTEALASVELYSCFPVVPKMARRVLGLPEGAALTANGGLTFHGAPLNAFMAHALVAAVRALRAAGGDARSLLYGQGGHLTSHHALLLGRAPGTDPARAFSRQAEADRRRGPAAAVRAQLEGPATLEAHTVLFGREGEVRHGAAVLRLPDGARALARVRDADTLARMTAEERTAIGTGGRLREGADGLGEWAA